MNAFPRATLSNTSINVPEEAYDYIKLQVGDIYGQEIPRAYINHITNIAEKFLPFFSTARSLVDIGSGLGGASMLIARELGARLHLVDGDESDGIPERKCEDKPFNSFTVSNSLMESNGMWGRVRFHHLTVDTIPPPVDAVMSVASWGFHYPLDRYMGIINRIKTGGRMIIDLREARDEIHKLRPYFEISGIMRENAKRIRYVLTRNDVRYNA